MTDLINIALEIGEQFPVFPCNTKKSPVCNGGFKAATQDPDEIERLFSLPNAALIGVPTGAVSGMSVVDIDVRDGKEGITWCHTNADNLGITKIARTQSGGYHYYYKHQDGIRNRAGIDRCVDVRGDGGYVIVPPSDGYTWMNDEELAEYPEFMKEAQSDMVNQNHSSQLTDAFGSLIDGREKYMSDLVYASTLDYVKEHNATPTEEWMVTNVWPTYAIKVKSRTGDLEEEDRGITMFMKKIRSTIGKMQREGVPVSKPVTPQVVERGEFDDPIEEEIDKGKNIGEVFTPIEITPEFKAPSRRITLKSLAELRSAPPAKFLIAPYIIEKSFGVLFGAPASFKSFLALDWCLSLAHGVDWNGRVVQQGTVVYLALEGQSGIAARAEAWHRDMNLSESDVPFYAVTVPLSMVDEITGDSDTNLLIEAIEEDLGGVPPTLIVVDTLARSFVGKDENSATDMGLFVRNIDTIKAHFDCTVLAVHHSGKDSDKGMRGSSALRGAVDSEFEIVRRKDTQQVALHVRKQKDTEEAEELWMDAREISWSDGRFGMERSSLVLDPMDGAPKKAEIISVDQQIAMDILDKMAINENALEKDHQGNYGIPENFWRETVCESVPNFEDRKAWYKFKSRLVNKGFINIINGLVSNANV